MKPMKPSAEEPDSSLAIESEKTLKVFSAKDLFGDSREIVIDHDGKHYRLRITRRGKLILQK